MVARVIERERPDAVLPTMGGQTALNTARLSRRVGSSTDMVDAIAAVRERGSDVAPLQSYGRGEDAVS